MGLAEIRAEVAAFAASFDPSLISPADAERVVRDATAIENIAATVKSLAAARAAKGGEWRRNGARSAAHDLARKTGSTVARAKEALDTGEKLAELPELDAAARSGELSPAQAAPIADAATADRASESRLVARAKRSSVAELRDECARTKAAAEADDDARHRAMHRSRSLRSFRCADRAGEIRYRSTLDEVAELMATIRGYGNREFDLARLDGRREPEEAYLADGLLAACRVAAGVAAGDHDTVTPTTAPPPAADTRSPGRDDDLFGGSDLAGRGGPPDGGAGPGDLTPASPAPRGRVRKPTPTKIVVRLDWDALVRGSPSTGRSARSPASAPSPSPSSER